MSKPQKLNDNQRKLVKDNLRLVHFIIAHSFPTFRGDEDIIHCGYFGLCQAALRWDESRCAFSTYASQCIRNAIKQELRDRRKNADTISLDTPIGEDLTLADTLSDDEEPYVIDDKFLCELTADERFVYELRSKGYDVVDIQQLTGFDSRKICKILRVTRAKYKNTT